LALPALRDSILNPPRPLSNRCALRAEPSTAPVF